MVVFAASQPAAGDAVIVAFDTPLCSLLTLIPYTDTTMDTPFLKPASDSLLKAANDRAADATTTELLIVEGKSAANALDQVRDRRRQGIFMMQGKIPNPETARLTRLQQHEQCAALMDLLKDDTANTTGYDHIAVSYTHLTLPTKA